MSGTSYDQIDVDHHVKIYLRVFAALAVLTVITVAVAELHLAPGWAIALALTIATVKGSLVACYFMHLISEKKLIYALLILAALFFLFELILPFVTENNSLHQIL
ncbi:MAG: hypothetical protein D6696_01815 [Acidobacteria bacterium]|nr:MAG: hypothetical protein D6696_01815 [Acidobacteriota bacterium]